MLRLWCVPLLVVLAGCRPGGQWNVVATAEASQPPGNPAEGTREPSSNLLEVSGQTFPAPGRISEITATVMHPVTRILVKPGDTVHAGQPLIELDADEPAAEVRAKRAEVGELTATLARLKALPRAEERAEARAQLESAQISTHAAREYLERLTGLRQRDAVSPGQHIEQLSLVRRAEADERAAQAHLDVLLKQPIEHEIAEAESKLAVAQAALEAAESELEHYTLFAAIEGVVCWLDVTPGTVSRAGTKVWGEIVDLRELDVRVELSPEQLRTLDRSQPVEIHQPELRQSWSAQYVYASPTANRDTGRIPVTLRVANAGEPLRCHLHVLARLKIAPPGESRPATDDTLAGEPAAGR